VLMEAQRRRILEGVRGGSISPDEALRLLEELEDEEPEEPRGVREEAGSRPEIIRVKHELGSLIVRADPSVARYRVSGRHSVEEDARGVLIKGDSSFVGIGYVMGPGERRPRWRWPGKEKGQYAGLHVDVNPSIPIDVELDAGRLQVVGVKAPVKARVHLGTMIVDDVEGSVDLSLDSGTIRSRGVVNGRSSMSCELGKVVAKLEAGSDVRVVAHCALGSVSLGDTDGRKQKRGGTESEGELAVGNGSGELDIRVECGSIKVAVGR
jgi:hypothetical protein